MVTLYSTGCPKCKVLKSKLDSKKIEYTIIEDIEVMRNKGFNSLPVLEVDGTIYEFREAVDYVNNL